MKGAVMREDTEEVVREMTEDEKMLHELDHEVQQLKRENESLRSLIIKLLMMAERDGMFK